MTHQELLDLDSDIADRLGKSVEFFSPATSWSDTGPLLDQLSKNIPGLLVSWFTTTMDPPGVAKTVAIASGARTPSMRIWGEDERDVKLAICRAWIAWDDAGRP